MRAGSMIAQPTARSPHAITDDDGMASDAAYSLSVIVRVYAKRE
jgi:hypothetical protein